MADTAKVSPSTKSDKPIPDAVYSFLESMLFDAGLDSVADTMREAMVLELFIRLDKFLINRITEYLSTEKLDEFAVLTENNPSQDAMQEYLMKHLPNAQDVFTVAFAEFRNLYLAGVANTKQQLGELAQSQTKGE